MTKVLEYKSGGRGGIATERAENIEKLYVLKQPGSNQKLLQRALKLQSLTKEAAMAIHRDADSLLVVDENISEQQLLDYGMIEFEDYIYERFLGKRIVVIYGNCHTSIIAEILNQCVEFNQEYKVYAIKPIHTIDSVSYFDKPIFRYCDVFIHQSIQKENRYGAEFSSQNIILRLNAKCQVIAVPNVYRLPVCFFPQYTREAEFVKRDGDSVFFRDSVLDDAAERGLSYKDTLDDYWNNIHFTDEHLDRLLELFFAKVEEREKDWDIKCLDFIKRSYKESQLFYDPNHPTNEFLFYVTMELLSLLGIQTKRNTLLDYDLPVLSGYEMPILPEVKAYFGMSFPDPQIMRHRSYNKVRMGNMKGYRDYVKQYLSCEWQNKKVKTLYAVKWRGVYYLMKVYNRIYKLISLTRP
ncbi:WcbI family polysaccharide biosynthesis putative acetyltransferase [Lacrimispora sp. 210928-DFI.3.58]|uniref:WcbI family polysaccharide biosynthesis putative acetyltransferase n=1 Tax=Lacrimispora sp. 210928-DFI.3.58 TaxID=2883214 RepID=UPI001D07E455|nr:WcbI family polysaccharide biosynthesis putative acetyltransferase [Lacrimispora sp. 210928-DFI.3.58]MCB7319562.1 hypothetical protein [Lacrimispora sp. 210928-DFI.3.58]